jgi:hypothetical protein
LKLGLFKTTRAPNKSFQSLFAEYHLKLLVFIIRLNQSHKTPMKKTLLLMLGQIAISGVALAQSSVLYQQAFGTVNGGTTLASVGWSEILPPAGFSGIYTQGGAISGTTSLALPTSTLYFGGGAGSGIFFTTDGAGSGSNGDSAFTSINPTLYTNLNISIESQWSWQGANLNFWFAVQVGGSWYVTTNQPITTAATSAGPVFYQSSITYNPAATNWNILTNTTAVDIGPLAGANLSGDITGIGIVAKLFNSGSWNFNNLLITSISNAAVQPPTLVAAPISQMDYAGAGVSFNVRATGSEPLTYIWKKDDVVLTNDARISGAATATLNLKNIADLDAGNYSVIVSNSAGDFDSATTSTAFLTVNFLPPDYLYAETFPFVGAALINYPVGVVGWSNSIPGAPSRLFQNSGGDAAFFAFEGAPVTTAFYVTTNSDSGNSGLKFPKITPSLYPAVSFQVDIAPTYQPANVTAYFAVQLNGGNWYVQSSPIPVDTSTATTTYATHGLTFDPLAANWNNLTLSASGATIGSFAAANLTGDITGAGLVFNVASGGGNFNVDNFLVVTNYFAPLPPTITASPHSQTVFAGAGVSFAGSATGNQPLTYYWEKDGSPVVNSGNISGANSNVLSILNVSAADAGSYFLIVSNSAGTDSSANYISTVLTVNERPFDLLYLEAFPFVGPVIANYPVMDVGWSAAVPTAPNRLFQAGAGDGGVFNYEGAAYTTAFFATTVSDTGISGLPFPTIGIAGASALTFGVDIAPTFSPENITASIAVQIDGAAWYVSATSLPVDTNVATTAYTPVSQVFSQAAANWKNLTISGTGATVGSTAGADLSGNITGAGLVFDISGAGGNFNFDNFQVTGTAIANPGSVTIGTITATTLTLNWTPSPNVRLQSATNLAPPTVWADVPGTTGQSSAIINTTGPQMFFRLIGQ